MSALDAVFKGMDIPPVVPDRPKREYLAPTSIDVPAYTPLEAIPGGEFIAGFQPLEQVIDGILPRNRVISITGPTGHAKTAIATVMQLCLVAGLRFAGRETAGGNVLALCGENPDDYAMRLIATSQSMGISEEALNRLSVIPDTFSIEHKCLEIDAIAERKGPFAAVFVDTSAAFYLEGDENDNVQMRRHASNMRGLTLLPGNPVVVVLCHPTKSATRENLLPRGGGAFLAEVDGNLTTWKDDSGIVTLHWAGKFRGPGFDPVRFELKPKDLDGHKDAKGRPITSVVAVHAPDERTEQIEAKSLDDENRLLRAMATKPAGSIADLAMAAGFTSGMGTPQKSRTHRLLEALKGQSLAEKTRNGTWKLTGKGTKAVEELR